MPVETIAQGGVGEQFVDRRRQVLASVPVGVQAPAERPVPRVDGTPGLSAAALERMLS
ncbi:MAG: hypothetical protein WBC01_14200 [Solirubrobacterales bacterium]